VVALPLGAEEPTLEEQVLPELLLVVRGQTIGSRPLESRKVATIKSRDLIRLGRATLDHAQHLRRWHPRLK
jgi:hypothetical protein